MSWMYSCSGRRGRPGRTAFTLVELLVVVAIIALLVTILMPALTRAKIITRTVLCQTNLHGIGRAAALYAVDNRNFVPRDYWYGCGNPNDPGQYGHYLFAAKFTRYVGGVIVPFDKDDKDDYIYDVLKELPIFRCPCVLDEDFVLTYVSNGMDFDYYDRHGGYTSGAASALSDLPGRPAEIFYVMEANIAMLDPFQFGVYDVLYPGNMPFSGDVPNEFPRAIRYDDNRHAGRTTVVFFDGHTEPRDLHPDDLPMSLFNPLAKD